MLVPQTRSAARTLTLASAIGVAACVCLAGDPPAAAPGQQAHAQSDQPVHRLVRLMTGAFASTEQAKADPDNFRDVHLHMTPIWTSRTDGPWLYVEQAMATSLDKPYRQRIYQLAPGAEPGTFESRVFELPGDPLAYAGKWNEPAAFDALAPESLTPRAGCTIVLRAEGDAFVGSTVDKNCLSSLRGATYATSEVRIDDSGLHTWDRGYDAQGTQVWGATAGGYQFVRVK